MSRIEKRAFALAAGLAAALALGALFFFVRSEAFAQDVNLPDPCYFNESDLPDYWSPGSSYTVTIRPNNNTYFCYIWSSVYAEQTKLSVFCPSDAGTACRKYASESGEFLRIELSNTTRIYAVKVVVPVGVADGEALGIKLTHYGSGVTLNAVNMRRLYEADLGNEVQTFLTQYLASVPTPRPGEPTFTPRPTFTPFPSEGSPTPTPPPVGGLKTPTPTRTPTPVTVPTLTPTPAGLPDGEMCCDVSADATGVALIRYALADAARIDVQLRLNMRSHGGFTPSPWHDVGEGITWDADYGPVNVCASPSERIVCVYGLAPGIYYDVRIRGVAESRATPWAEKARPFLVAGAAPVASPTFAPGQPTPVPTNAPRLGPPTATPVNTPTPSATPIPSFQPVIASIEYRAGQSEYKAGEDAANTLTLQFTVNTPSAKNNAGLRGAFLGYKLAACLSDTDAVQQPYVAVDAHTSQSCGIVMRGVGGQDSFSVTYMGAAADRDDRLIERQGVLLGDAVSDASAIYFWLVAHWDADNSLYPSVTQARTTSPIYTFINPLMESRDTRAGRERIIPGEIEANYMVVGEEPIVNVNVTGPYITQGDDRIFFRAVQDWQTQINDSEDYITIQAEQVNVGTEAQGGNYNVNVPYAEVVKGEPLLRTRGRIGNGPAESTPILVYIPFDNQVYRIPPYTYGYMHWTNAESQALPIELGQVPFAEATPQAADVSIVNAAAVVVNLLDPTAVGETRTNTGAWLMLICFFMAVVIGGVIGSYAAGPIGAVFGGGFFFLLVFSIAGLLYFKISIFIIAPIWVALIGIGAFAVYLKK